MKVNQIAARPVIFQSLYSEANLTNLKHALFYFGKLTLPMHGFLFTLGDEPPTGDSVRYITLIPESVHEQIEWLEENGHCEILDVQKEGFLEGALEPQRLSEAIIEEMKSRPQRSYYAEELDELFNFFQIPKDHANTDVLIGYVPFLFTSLALQLVGRGRGLPCVDHPILFDLFNLGLKKIFESFVNSSGFEPAEIRDLKEQYLAQKLIALHLPEFEFHTFEDVLEARERLKSEIDRFRAQISQLALQFGGWPWAADLDSKIQQIITKEVQPELRNIQEQSKFRIANVIRRVAGPGILVAFQSMFPEWVEKFFTGVSAMSVFEAIKKERERGKTARIESSFSILLRKESEF